MGDICLGMEVGRAADIDCPGIERDLHLCLTVPSYVLSLLWPSFCSHRLLPLALSPACPYPILTGRRPPLSGREMDVRLSNGPRVKKKRR